VVSKSKKTTPEGKKSRRSGTSIFWRIVLCEDVNVLIQDLLVHHDGDWKYGIRNQGNINAIDIFVNESNFPTWRVF
jgi:hypothetical protein